jgi:outer membrane translocation and assembly module TamA
MSKWLQEKQMSAFEVTYQGKTKTLQGVGVSDTVGTSTRFGFAGSRTVGLGFNFMYDNRSNFLNPRRGYYLELSRIVYSPVLGSQHRFSAFQLDGRMYMRPFAQKQTLALQYLYVAVSGQPPFNQMALLGSDQIMRGYYNGRYRDLRYMALQAEYRFLPFPFSERLGGTVFVSAGDVASRLHRLNPLNFKVAGGLGARYLLLKPKDFFVRLDMAITHEQIGWYVFLGEAF